MSYGKGIGEAIIAMIIIAFIIGLAIMSTFWFFFRTTEFKTNKPIKPEIIIETKSINGIMESDTTYIYKKP